MQNVKTEVLLFGVAFGAGLLVLLAWPDRSSANQNLVYFAGMLTLIVLGISGDWLVLHRRPTFDVVAFLTMTRPPRKPQPRRHTLPTLLSMVAALTFANWLNAVHSPDWGLTAYVVTVPLLLAGFVVAKVWSARAINTPSGVIFPLAD